MYITVDNYRVCTMVAFVELVLRAQLPQEGKAGGGDDDFAQHRKASGELRDNTNKGPTWVMQHV